MKLTSSAGKNFLSFAQSPCDTSCYSSDVAKKRMSCRTILLPQQGKDMQDTGHFLTNTSQYELTLKNYVIEAGESLVEVAMSVITLFQ